MTRARMAPDHVQRLLSKLNGVKSQAGGWAAFCPAHRDRNEPSLSVAIGDNGAAVLHCHAQCDAGDVLAAVGLTWADVSPAGGSSGAVTPGAMHPGAYRAPGAALFDPAAYAPASGTNGSRADTPHALTVVRGTGGQGGDADAARAAAGDPKTWPIAATFEYADGDGSPSYRVLRLEPALQPVGGERLKSFRLQHWTGAGWGWGLGDAAPTLYRLPSVLDAAASGRTVLLVEGEKCVAAAERLGYVATCNHGGAKGWRSELAALLAGADVVVVPDHDEPGREWAHEVGASVIDAGGSVRVLPLPGVGPKGDIADYLDDGLAAGLSLGELAGRLAHHVDRAIAWRPGEPIPLPPEPSRFRILSDLELEELPPPEWLADGLVQCGTLATLYGPPGSGKSFLTVDLAAAIATGGAWMGRPVKAGSVLYVAAEGDAGLPQRLAAWKAAHGYVGRSIPVHFITEAPDLHGRPDVAHVVRAAEYVTTPTRPLRLIVVDTMARTMVGADENSAQDVGTVIAHADAIRRATGATVLLVHHAQKEGDELRGSSALLGACESVLFCRTDDADAGGSVGAKRTLSTKKQKDAPDSGPIAFTLEAQVATVRGQPVGSCVVKLLDAAALAAPAQLDARQLPPAYVDAMTTLRDAFGADGALTSEWLDASGLKRRTFYRVSESLGRAGLVLPRVGEAGSRSKRYQLTPEGRRVLAELANGATRATSAAAPVAQPRGLALVTDATAYDDPELPI